MEIIHREFLPSYTSSVHASTIEFYKNHPVFAWFGGTREGTPNVRIYLYNLNDDKQKHIIDDFEPIARWNPILVNIDEHLYLFEKAGVFCDRWQTFMYDISEFDIITSIQERKMLPAGLNGPVKSKPVLIDNCLYCGSSCETIYNWTSYVEQYKVDKNGFRFLNRSLPLVAPETKASGFNVPLGIIQPTLWEENGNLYAFFRSSKGLGKIYYSECTNIKDNIWSDPVPTSMANPNSAVDVVFMNDNLYLVWNPDPVYRFPLVLSRLQRNNNDFEVMDTITISDKSSLDKNDCNSMELSYPYLIEHDGKLHLTYTFGRSKIEYCVINVE